VKNYSLSFILLLFVGLFTIQLSAQTSTGPDPEPDSTIYQDYNPEAEIVYVPAAGAESQFKNMERYTWDYQLDLAKVINRGKIHTFRDYITDHIIQISKGRQTKKKLQRFSTATLCQMLWTMDNKGKPMPYKRAAVEYVVKWIGSYAKVVVPIRPESRLE
jgi:hypothetical protein